MSCSFRSPYHQVVAALRANVGDVTAFLALARGVELVRVVHRLPRAAPRAGELLIHVKAPGNLDLRASCHLIERIVGVRRHGWSPFRFSGTTFGGRSDCSLGQ